MATAAPRPLPTKPVRSVRAPAIAAVVVAGTAAALFVAARPDPLPPPRMADSPVVLPDGRELHVQKYEVTVAEWNRCHADGACSLELRPPAGQPADRIPATGLNYTDVAQYLEWFNERARGTWRLPTAGEWNHMAAEVLPAEPDPIFSDASLSWASAYRVTGNAPRALERIGHFSVSPEGIADLDGNVWEWTQDCYRGTGAGDPAGRCPAYYLGGEHLAAMSFLVRDPARGGCAVGLPPAHLGMRLVSDVPAS